MKIPEDSIKRFAPTWLMVKMHTASKLLYFCKTSTQDPMTYRGSGTYWKNHIRKHGRNKVITIWRHKFDDVHAMVDFAIKFSIMFDVVKSKRWANQIIETGLDNTTGAPRSDALKHAHSEFMKQWCQDHPEEVARRTSAAAATMKERHRLDPNLGKKHSQPGVLNPMYGVVRPQEWRDNHSLFMTENNPMKGRTGDLHHGYGKPNVNKGKKIEEYLGIEDAQSAKAKMSARAKNREKLTCPHCGVIGQPSNMRRWHFDNCKFIINQ